MWEADVDWSEYFQPSNRIWYDLLDGEQFDERHTAADADFPQFKMYHRSGAGKEFLTTPTLDTFHNEGHPANWISKPSTVVRLEMMSDNINLRGMNMPKAVTLQAMRRSGSMLGMPELCAGWQFTYVSTRVNDETTHGMFRWKTTMDVLVMMEFDGAQYI